ncbi:hypothetical protein ACEYW6_11975 [Nostoc sp. UIC 10607]|uniref:hypothetical protein n=1 Tax=Nostoc sp. UIC 10607 TaxID=3045935 RepID=UPI0039A07026
MTNPVDKPNLEYTLRYLRERPKSANNAEIIAALGLSNKGKTSGKYLYLAQDKKGKFYRIATQKAPDALVGHELPEYQAEVVTSGQEATKLKQEKYRKATGVFNGMEVFNPKRTAKPETKKQPQILADADWVTLDVA